MSNYPDSSAIRTYFFSHEGLTHRLVTERHCRIELPSTPPPLREAPQMSGTSSRLPQPQRRLRTFSATTRTACPGLAYPRPGPASCLGPPKTRRQPPSPSSEHRKCPVVGFPLVSPGRIRQAPCPFHLRRF